jgi:hypothetical protein
MKPVESVIPSRTNGPLIAAAARLWIRGGDQVLDVTYGKGNFWTEYRPTNLIAHDKYKLDGVDFRQLPEPDCSIDVVIFDPPYIAQGGRETSGIKHMLDAYGLHDVPKTPRENRELIAAGMKEGFRVLSAGGRLLVKCMDYINGSEFQMGHHHVVSTALELGMEQVDEFVHYSGKGPQPTLTRSGAPRGQYHSRRAHTFLCVFQVRPGHDQLNLLCADVGAPPGAHGNAS